MPSEQTGTAHDWLRKKRKIAVYRPTSVIKMESQIEFASRIHTFDGKRIGLLWNGKPNGDFFLNRVGALLEKSYQDTEMIKFWEIDPNGTAHPDGKSDEVLDRIAKDSDIVISAQGD